LAARYGREIIRFMRSHGHPVAFAIAAVVAIAAIVFLVLRYGKKGKSSGSKKGKS